MRLQGKNRHMVVEPFEQEEQSQDTIILLPDDYRTQDSIYTVGTIKESSSCSSEYSYTGIRRNDSWHDVFILEIKNLSIGRNIYLSTDLSYPVVSDENNSVFNQSLGYGLYLARLYSDNLFFC